MIQKTHTPGPWTYVRNPMRDDGFFVHTLLHKKLKGVSRLDGLPIVEPVAYVTVFQVEREADARLIAAAPDLLAALEAIVAFNGAFHEADCGGDSSCECAGKPVNDLINRSMNKVIGPLTDFV